MMRLRRCKHEHLRCIHSDEIIARRGRRVACSDCGRALPGALPGVCSVTGLPHPGKPVGGEEHDRER